MKVSYYSVEDVKAEQFGPLFPAKNDEVAKRMFKQLLRDVDPEYLCDYLLFRIVEFFDEDGSISDGDLENPVCCGSDVMEVKK